MNGMFDIKLINNREKGDQYFQDAIDGGYIMDALDDLPMKQHLPAQQNRVFDNYAGCSMRLCLSGPAHAHTTWDRICTEATTALLWFVNLSTNSSTTSSYTEDYSSYFGNNNTISAVSGTANSSSGSKRFIEDDITAPTIWSDTARETIYFRNRFLWLPSQGNSNSIKSIAIYAGEDGDSTTLYYDATGRVARVRLRDADGVLTTLNKTSSNSLLVEYTFSLVSW